MGLFDGFQRFRDNGFGFGSGGLQGLFQRQMPGSLGANLGTRSGITPHPLAGSQGTAVPATSLEQQYSALTGGLPLSPNANLGGFVDQTGAVTGQVGLLNPRRGELADSILGQFGLSGNPMQFLTNGQLDLTKFGPSALRNLSPEAIARMQGANVLGADLLSNLGTLPTRPVDPRVDPVREPRPQTVGTKGRDFFRRSK